MKILSALLARSPMNYPHKGQWHGALMFSLICTGTNSCVNNRDAGDLRHHRTHYDITVVQFDIVFPWWRHQMETVSALLALCAGIHQSSMNSPHKGMWRGALMFSLICIWTNGWVNNRDAVYLRHHRAHYDVTGMKFDIVLLYTAMLHWINSSQSQFLTARCLDIYS